jgi:LPXTG-site transpeptidase (sortase) family protein
VVVLVLGLAGTGSGRSAEAGVPLPPSAAYHPVGPRRVLDTRRAATPLAAGSTLDVRLGSAGVPAGASAAVLEVTATAASGPGFLTVYPAGSDRPTTSVLNTTSDGATVQNLVTMAIGTGGAVSIFSSVQTDVVVDLFGYYEPSWSSASGRFVPLPPSRLLDTRSSTRVAPGGTVRVALPSAMPPDASAIVATATVDQATAAGYWTAGPAGGPRPDTSNINVSRAGQTVANLIVVPVSADGIDVYSQSGGHLIVDAVGYYTGASAPVSTLGLFYPRPPMRLLDTRSDTNPLGPGAQPQRGWTVEVGAGATFSAAMTTVTVAHALGPGYVTAYAAGQPRPPVSTVNAGTDDVVAQSAIVPVGARGMALYTYGGGDLLLDVTGWFAGAPAPAVENPPTNPAPPAPDRIVIPSVGVDEHHGTGVDAATLAAGPGFWPEFGQLGQPGNIVVGGHRTIDSAPFRHIDAVPTGGDIYLFAGGDRHHYRVVDRFVVDYRDGWPVVRQTTAHELSVFACHPPGSEQYRYVLRAIEIRD